MGKWKRAASVVLASVMLVSLSACGNSSSGEQASKTNGSGETKDTLNVAYNAQPATFDPHVTGATATREIDRNVLEGLVEEDKDGNPQPQLAESYESNADYTEWTFKLRKGVLFQNEQEMTSADVIASLNRWLDKCTIARKSIPTEYFEAVDEYTVKISLNEPCILLPYVLCNYAQFPGIMPASIIEQAGSENLSVDKIIGTGSYQFVDWVVDSHIQLKKFDNYKPAAEESSGAWGDRTAYVDNVYIYFVTDTTTRLNGLQTGEYDISSSIAYTDYSTASNAQNIELSKSNWNSVTITMNKSEDSILNNPKWRQIISYSMSSDEILEGSYSTMSDYVPYYADGSYFDKESQWYADVSSIQKQDLAKAKELLAEVNYDGTPLVMMTTQAYPELYNATLILQQELEKIGVKVDLQVYDWGTMLTKISDTKAFDLYPMCYPASSNPASINYLMKTNASGFTNDAQLTAYVKEMQASKSLEEAKTFWDSKVMPYCAESVFILHLGTYDTITGVSDKVSGFNDYYGMELWGITVSD